VHVTCAWGDVYVFEQDGRVLLSIDDGLSAISSRDIRLRPEIASALATALAVWQEQKASVADGR
jgi:hypothetical protein